MTTQTEALKLALEAADELEWMLKSGYEHGREGPPRVHRLIAKIRTLSAQQSNEQVEPVAWTDKAFERLCENWNHMTSEEFAIVQRFIFGVYAHPSVPTAQSKEPEHEPVAVMELYTDGWDLVEGIDTDWLESLPFGTRLYTTPPQRTWVNATTWRGLTDEEVKHMLELFVVPPHHVDMVVQAIEAKLKEKNT